MKYNVIYADPPWSYDNKTTGRTNGSQPEGSGAATKYPTMPLDVICSMKNNELHDIIDKDAVLFLWATVPLLPEALQVMKAWGFEYKTKITWRKVMSQGLGYWFRGQCEDLFLGIKGNVKAFREQTCNYYESEYDFGDVHQQKVGRHSQKPHYFRDLIVKVTDRVFENPKRLELFAREREGMFANYEYEGWSVLGNEIETKV